MGDAKLLTLLDERLALLADLKLCDAALVISQAPDAPPLSADALLETLERWAQPVALLGAGELEVPALAAAAARRGIRWLEPTEGDEREAENMRDLEHGEARKRSLISARIAAALLVGDVRAAAGPLGRPYGVRGEVSPGDRRGRVLGFPTANLRLDARKLLPADGIYAVRAQLPGEPRASHSAVASLGVRPQFGDGGPRLLEVFVLDAALDLYGLSTDCR
jgi:hypothetical protein